MSAQDHNIFDSMLREKLAGQQLSAPDGLKAKVEADFMRTRRKGLFFWWWGGFASVLLSAAVVFLDVRR